jgi:hypothetical protein
MHEAALKLVQSFPDQARLARFAGRLLEWLVNDLGQGDQTFTESRAKALLRAGETLDEPTRHTFERLVGVVGEPSSEPVLRIAIYDLLADSGLADNEDVKALAIATAQAAAPDNAPAANWFALAVAAAAWKSDILLSQLDPASPPDTYSPAGQAVRRAAAFIRQQVQRSATERDKLGRKLGYDPTAAGTPSLDALPQTAPVAPLPPHYRMPVPVRYPEVARETIHIDDDEEISPGSPVTRGEPIKIGDDELGGDAAASSGPIRQPPLRIEADQIPPAPAPTTPSPRPPRASQVVTPPATTTANVHRPARRGSRPTQTTRLRVLVQEHPDGPGLYGLQVRVSSKGLKSFVAGTTNREGAFTCEVPVHRDSGLTYDVDLTWPRDYGSEVERKSITLNSDRTLFTLPFYRTLKA